MVEGAVEECLGQAVVSAPERVLGGILERHREFERLRQDAKRVLREEQPKPRSLLAQPNLPDEEPRRPARVKA